MESKQIQCLRRDLTPAAQECGKYFCNSGRELESGSIREKFPSKQRAPHEESGVAAAAGLHPQMCEDSRRRGPRRGWMTKILQRKRGSAASATGDGRLDESKGEWCCGSDRV